MSKYAVFGIGVTPPPLHSSLVSQLPAGLKWRFRSFLRPGCEQFHRICILVPQPLVDVIKLLKHYFRANSLFVFLEESLGITRRSRKVNHLGFPARMDNLKIVAFQGKWQRGEEAGNANLVCVLRRSLYANSPLLVGEFFPVEPFILGLLLIQHDVQVMITENALSHARRNKPFHKIDHSNAVRSSVGEVAQNTSRRPAGCEPSLP